ncbi:MAG: hypothetical protein JOZ18_14325 [Chloroflexi bacterium]|nr:hypothetical protein [Chloroflexota bacterium]
MSYEYRQREQEQQSMFEEGYRTEYRPVDDFERTSHSHFEQPLHTQQQLFATPLPHTDPRFVAVLCYSLGWFSGLLFAIFTRENRYIRYHALQSLAFFGGINLLDIALMIVGFGLGRFHLFLPGFVIFGSFMLLNIIAFVGWLVSITQAYRGTYYRLPLVGDFVARTFNLGTPLK